MTKLINKHINEETLNLYKILTEMFTRNGSTIYEQRRAQSVLIIFVSLMRFLYNRMIEYGIHMATPSMYSEGNWFIQYITAKPVHQAKSCVLSMMSVSDM